MPQNNHETKSEKEQRKCKKGTRKHVVIERTKGKRKGQRKMRVLDLPMSWTRLR